MYQIDATQIVYERLDTKGGEKDLSGEAEEFSWLGCAAGYCDKGN